MSGGADGNGTIAVAVHDGVFEKSDNYRHVATAVRLLRSKCVTMLVEDRNLHESCGEIGYKKLSSDQQSLVDDAMPYVFGMEVDGWADHNNTHFQNMLAYTGCFF